MRGFKRLYFVAGLPKVWNSKSTLLDSSILNSSDKITRKNLDPLADIFPETLLGAQAIGAVVDLLPLGREPFPPRSFAVFGTCKRHFDVLLGDFPFRIVVDLGEGRINPSHLMAHTDAEHQQETLSTQPSRCCPCPERGWTSRHATRACHYSKGHP